MRDDLQVRLVEKGYAQQRQDGVHIDAGPYTAIVKNVYDTTRKGRLGVYVPLFGGDPDDEGNWFTVSYASPYAGHTRIPGSQVADKSINNTFSYSEQTYGFWAVPPDIGNTVLIIFANNSVDDGYWFACIIDSIQQHMVPNIPGSGSATNISGDIEGTTLKRAVRNLGLDANLPTAELNRYDPKLVDQAFSGTVKRPLHEIQALVYIQQGLDRDAIRGPSQGSSQRESPSTIFGMSTPGRPIADIKDDKIFTTTGGKELGSLSQAPVLGRKGGHIFYMDDGDIVGQGQQIRLRTSGGHQILMDDSNGVLSIHNLNGSVWLEMARSGQIHIYSQGGLNFRSQGDINIHSDKSIKLNAAEEVKIRGQSGIRMEGAKTDISAQQLKLSATGRLDFVSKSGQMNIDVASSIGIKAGGTFILNSKGKANINDDACPKKPTSIKPPKGLTTYVHGDVQWNSAGAYWEVRGNQIRGTCVNILPTHEPWDRNSGVSEKNAGNTAIEAPVDINVEDPPVTQSKADPNIAKNALPGQTITKSTVPIGSQGITLPDGYNLNTKPGWDYIWNNTGSYVDVPDSRLTKWMEYFKPYADSYSFGTLTGNDLAALMASTFYRESSDTWGITSNPSYMGGFQFGVLALQSVGLLAPGTSTQQAFVYNTPNVWTGVVNGQGNMGINSLQDFLNNPDAQTQAYLKLAQINYQYMVKQGVINADSPPEQIAAAIAMAHGLGAGDTTTYLSGGTPSRAADGYGTTYKAIASSTINAIQKTR